MGEVKPDTILNVALVSYTGAGKTSLAEAMLYAAGAIPTMGSIQGGNTVSDFEPEELARKFSISSTVVHFPWKDLVFNVVDTPGSLSFLGEAKTALRGVDGVVIVLGASHGVRAEMEKIWATVTELQLPCLLFINELDKERTNFQQAYEECLTVLKCKGVPIVFPLGSEAQLEGVLDIVGGVAIRSAAGSAKVQQGNIPPESVSAVEDARKALAEGAAEGEDELLEKYLNEGDLTVEEIRRGLQLGTQSQAFVPILCGSAVRNVGVVSLLEVMAAYLPSPQRAAERHPIQGVHPRLSYVRVLSGTLPADSTFLNSSRGVKEKGGHLFSILGKKYTQTPSAGAGDIVAIGKLKETQTGDTICDDHHPIRYPGIQLPKPFLSFAIEPKSKGDIEKVSLGLHKLVEEDPTLGFERNQETKEMILSGVGQLHIDLTFDKLRRKYGAEVNIHTPKVPYKETIKTMAQAQGKYKKQTGGHGQFGDCWLQLDPLPHGEGFRFKNKIVGGAIPRNFIPAVEKGVVEAMRQGALGGFPVVDIGVTVYDGSYHTVDSSEQAFKVAASMGFKKAMEAAHPVLLEPIMTVEVIIPDDCVGGVIGDLNSKRGRVLGVNAKGSTQIIKAHVPLAEMLKYVPTLNALTGGRGTYGMEFSNYEEVPRDQANRVIEEYKAAKQAATA